MFGRDGGTKARVGSTALAMKDYVGPLTRDTKLRERLAAALLAGAAAGSRMRTQTGVSGLTRRLVTDPVFRQQLVEMTAALQAVQERAKKAHNHRVRNTVLFATGVVMTIGAVPAARAKVASMTRDLRAQWKRLSEDETSTPKPTTIEEQVDVSVPVSTAYNQWTQFEEFPRFMAGVEEVRQLDDTLLHWAVKVAGKRAEWDAKIVEQEPDRRITWESTDGRHTRGTVSFEDAGSGRTRVHLRMSYTPGGVAEKVGSAIGLDHRRIRGDLQRFRDLIEAHQDESGAWRGEIHAGVKSSKRSSPEA